MEIRTIPGLYESDVPIKDTDNFTIPLARVGGRLEHEIVISGKELKRIVELINTFTKIQDNPAPMEGLSSLVGMLKNFGAK